MQRTLKTYSAFVQCPATNALPRRRCQQHRVASPVSTRSGMRDEVAHLNTGKSPVEELSGETNTMVTDVMDIDRTPELLAWMFSGLFGRSQDAPAPSPPPPPTSDRPTSSTTPQTLPASTSASASSASQPAAAATATGPAPAAPPSPTASSSPSPPPPSHPSPASASRQPPDTDTDASDGLPGTSGFRASEDSNSSAKKVEVATVGGGCFWCIEACFRELRGVLSVTSGYAGGHVPNPTYQQVCSKTTGHAEVVQIQYDTAVLSYRDVLQVFMSIHDPTTPNRSGNDVGPQYRSIILTHDQRQAEVAAEVLAEANRGRGWFGRRVCTELAPLRQFYPAEAVHQRYYARNPGAGYCVFVVRPKLQEFRRKYAKLLRQQDEAAPAL